MKSLLTKYAKYGKRIGWLFFILFAVFFLTFLLVSERVSFLVIVLVGMLFSASVSLTIYVFSSEPGDNNHPAIDDEDDEDDYDEEDDDDDDDMCPKEEGRQLVTFKGEGIGDQSISATWCGSVVEVTTREGIKLDIHVQEGVRGWSVAQVQVEQEVCLVSSGGRELEIVKIIVV